MQVVNTEVFLKKKKREHGRNRYHMYEEKKQKI